MEILYVCHRYPYPPKHGGNIRSFNMIKHLSDGHRVTVATLVRSRNEEIEGRGLEDYADTLIGHVSEPQQTFRTLARLPTAIPSSMGYFYSAELASKVQNACEERRFDLIFVHCSSVAQYVSHVGNVPKILDFCDMDSQKWLAYSKVRRWPLSFGYWLEGIKLERAERQLAKQFDMCTVTTKKELETLCSYNTGTETDWFPNCVDANYFEPDSTPYDPDLISFIGRMDYYPNQQCMFDFCERVFPIIRQHRPRTTLVIVGANPSTGVRKLGEQTGVTVTGSVRDVRPYVRKSALTVAPLTVARGTQNKILEAMAMGVPTVTSKIAAGGVDAIPGEHVLTGSTTEEYVEAILRILEHPDERRRLSIQGRQRMLSHHDWKASMAKMESIIERGITSFHRGSGAQFARD